jgi:hypothetical protein
MCNSDLFTITTNANLSPIRRGFAVGFANYNPSWKENQRKKKREFLDPRVTNITPGGHKQKGLHLFFLTF